MYLLLKQEYIWEQSLVSTYIEKSKQINYI